MGKSKLRAALAAEKGTDFKKLKEKRKHKAAVKRKQPPKVGAAATSKAGKGGNDDEEDWEDEEENDGGGAPVDGSDEDDDDDDDDEDEHLDIAALNESDSDSGMEFEEKIERKPRTILKAMNAKDGPAADKQKNKKKTAKGGAAEADEDEDDEEEDDEDIPMSDIEDREDLVPHSRLTINNTSALLASLHRIAIPTTGPSVTFASHQSVVSAAPTAEAIEDVQDDLKRELALYAQSLDAARRARSLLRAEGVPFSRPTDYFAEMVKDDGHMDKVKAKLVEEASAKRASAEARKQRDLKKFGKQVQVAKLQERSKAKRETLEKIKSLKRKRSESGGADLGTNEADLFDVGVESELKANKRGGNDKAFGGGGGSDRRGGGGGGAGAKRQKKNEKYGFGGKKRHAKSNDAASSGDLSGFNARRMKTGGGGGGKPAKTARLGKSRRNAGKR